MEGGGGKPPMPLFSLSFFHRRCTAMELIDVTKRQGELRRRMDAAVTDGDLLVIPDKLTAFAQVQGLPERLAPLRLKDIKNEELRADLREHLESLRQQPMGLTPGLVISGPSNGARRELAAICMTGAMNRGRTTIWSNFAEFAEWATDRVDISKNTNQFEDGLLDEWYRQRLDLTSVYDVWVLNDLRLSLMTPFIQVELFKVISSRVDRGLYTVITTRHDREDLESGCPDVFDMLDLFYGIQLGLRESVVA